MIGVLAIGRLGNQLFQYAFALELASRLQTDFFIKDENHLHKFYVDKYFNLSGFNRTVNKYRVLKNRKYSLTKSASENPASDNFKHCLNDSLYHGFYQSTEYFPSLVGCMNELVTVKKKNVLKFEHVNPDFYTSKNIVVHVRGTDYKSNDQYPLTSEYYQKALDSISNINEYKIHLVTDDSAYAYEMLPDGYDYSFSKGTEIEDFIKIMSADIAIIANSSFSWWAAFLNQKLDKKIYAPTRWLGTDENPYPHEILVNTNFIKMEEGK
ncbi:MAG: hypothetical protein ACJASM_001669 [Salibacteraceae bacterium]|jgi:hypothetical protein